MAFAADSKRIKPNYQIYRWTIRMYGVSAAIGIRRVLDSNTRTYSLLLLLQKIANNPQAITRKSYVASFPKGSRDLGEGGFDRLAGEGAIHLPKSIVEADLRELEQTRARILPDVDKLIAHKERLKFGLPKHRRATFQHLHDAISLLDRMTCRYRLILKRVGNNTLLPGNLDEFNAEIAAVWR